jgi:hypothetical protein
MLNGHGRESSRRGTLFRAGQAGAILARRTTFHIAVVQFVWEYATTLMSVL